MYLCSMKKLFAILVLSAISCHLWAQETETLNEETCSSPFIYNNTFASRGLSLLVDQPDIWLQEASFTDSCSRETVVWNKWRFGVDVTTFFRDAEFFLPYTKGYTATGFFLNPYAKRMVGSHAQVTLGVHLAGVAGYDGIRKWRPLVRLEYEPHPNWRLVMGSLYGTLSHGLFEPMLDRERYIYDHQEEGLQILGHLSFGPCRLQTDTWVYWEELLEPWQPTQERFTLGSSNEFRLFAIPMRSDGGVFSVGMPFSFLGSHRGGQFTALDTCIQTLFNENVGLRLTMAKRFKYRLDLDVPFFFYQDMSPTKCMAYDNGWGVWPQLGFRFLLPKRVQKAQWHGTWQMQLKAGYWHGHQFIAPRGSYLFQSISWHNANFSVPEREMMTAQVALENRYGRLTFGLDAEFYYDLREEGTDMAFGIYMRGDF